MGGEKFCVLVTKLPHECYKPNISLEFGIKRGLTDIHEIYYPFNARKDTALILFRSAQGADEALRIPHSVQGKEVVTLPIVCESGNICYTSTQAEMTISNVWKAVFNDPQWLDLIQQVQETYKCSVTYISNCHVIRGTSTDVLMVKEYLEAERYRVLPRYNPHRYSDPTSKDPLSGRVFEGSHFGGGSRHVLSPTDPHQKHRSSLPIPASHPVVHKYVVRNLFVWQLLLKTYSHKVEQIQSDFGVTISTVEQEEEVQVMVCPNTGAVHGRKPNKLRALDQLDSLYSKVNSKTSIAEFKKNSDHDSMEMKAALAEVECMYVNVNIYQQDSEILFVGSRKESKAALKDFKILMSNHARKQNQAIRPNDQSQPLPNKATNACGFGAFKRTVTDAFVGGGKNDKGFKNDLRDSVSVPREGAHYQPPGRTDGGDSWRASRSTSLYSHSTRSSELDHGRDSWHDSHSTSLYSHSTRSSAPDHGCDTGRLSSHHEHFKAGGGRRK